MLNMFSDVDPGFLCREFVMYELEGGGVGLESVLDLPHWFFGGGGGGGGIIHLHSIKLTLDYDSSSNFLYDAWKVFRCTDNSIIYVETLSLCNESCPTCLDDSWRDCEFAWALRRDRLYGAWLIYVSDRKLLLFSRDNLSPCHRCQDVATTSVNAAISMAN